MILFMNDKRLFVDTNVLVYVFDSDSPEKQAIAKSVLSSIESTLVLSPQVLGEFFVTVTRKLAKPLTVEKAFDAVCSLEQLQVQPLTGALVIAAIERMKRSRFSYWDSLIVETSIAAGADTLLTEDLQHGQQLDSVQVHNPFEALANK